MSKKILDVEGITNELEGASLFFTGSHKPSPPPSKPSEKNEAEPQISSESPAPESVPVSTISSQAPKEDRHASYNNHSNKVSPRASKQASNEYQIYDPVETIRKTVKQVGKEVLFVRITPEEKRTLGSIVYSFNEIYRDEGRKTSENEIGRIGLNYLLEDYRANGENSILARVLAALNA